MNFETIVHCVVALILGMLLVNMLKDVCGCNKVVEGQGTCSLGQVRKQLPEVFSCKNGSNCEKCVKEIVAAADCGSAPWYNMSYAVSYCDNKMVLGSDCGQPPNNSTCQLKFIPLPPPPLS